ncbi:hypothetical protein ACIBI9_19515 [Nonomuraea sp. NPDC050451]|uniref:hypothetical protein n=1 Tax=Nonomuraea sp. NPDC050451 TaxID=3364364 RepID=UPI00379635A8
MDDAPPKATSAPFWPSAARVLSDARLLDSGWPALRAHLAHDDPDLPRLRTRFRRVSVEGAAARLRYERMQRVWVLVGFAVLGAAWTVFLVWAFWGHAARGPVEMALLLAAALAVSTLIAVVVLILAFSVARLPWADLAVLVLAMATAVAAVAAGVRRRDQVTPLFGGFSLKSLLIVLMQSAGSFFLLLTAAAVLFVAVTLLLRAQVRRAVPVTILLALLARSIESIHRPARHIDSEQIVRDLSEVERVLARGLIHTFPPVNAAARATVRARLEEAAAAVGEYQIWVALPNHGTFPALADRLGYALTGPGRDTALAGAILWAAAVLMRLLDPNLHGHLTVAKDLTSFFRSGPGVK